VGDNFPAIAILWERKKKINIPERVKIFGSLIPIFLIKKCLSYFKFIPT
jgi:hypothetical protein